MSKHDHGFPDSDIPKLLLEGRIKFAGLKEPCPTETVHKLLTGQEITAHERWLVANATLVGLGEPAEDLRTSPGPLTSN